MGNRNADMMTYLWINSVTYAETVLRQSLVLGSETKIENWVYEKGNAMSSQCQTWSEGDLVLEEYHDHEWCKINHDDDFEFEMLCLEWASVGLSWATVMHKRENYRWCLRSYDRWRTYGFNVIYRPHTKSKQDLQRPQECTGSTEDTEWVRLFWWDGQQIDRHWKELSEIAVESNISIRLSKDMKKRGISSVGPVITYSFLQSIGIVNDHLVDCKYR